MSLNINATINDIAKKLGVPKQRAAFGTWPSYAWVVRGLVEQGHSVTPAVRQVLESTGMGRMKQAAGSLRAAYYKIRDKEWPAELSNAATAKSDEEFE